MLFLGDIPSGWGEYMIITGVAIVLVIALVIIGIRYLKKSRVIKKDSSMIVIYMCSGLLILLTVVFTFILPNLVGGSGFGEHSGYINAFTAILWALGIFIVAYIICMYLINSKKKILTKLEEERENNEK